MTGTTHGASATAASTAARRSRWAASSRNVGRYRKPSGTGAAIVGNSPPVSALLGQVNAAGQKRPSSGEKATRSASVTVSYTSGSGVGLARWYRLMPVAMVVYVHGPDQHLLR